MLKLNAGFSRKIGEPNYSSRGASVNVELELESTLLGDQTALTERIRRLFEIARGAVEAELTRTGDNQRSSQLPERNQNRRHAADHEGGGSGRQARYATASQQRAIRAICERLGCQAEQVAHERHGVRELSQLTLSEASQLIDALKRESGNGAQS